MPEGGFLKRFFASKAYIVLAVIFVFFLGIAYGRAYYQNYLIKQEIRRMQEEEQNLIAKKIISENTLNYVKTEQFAIDEAKRIGLKEEGENVTVISREEAVGVGQTEEKVVKSIIISNPKKWWNYFFNNI